MPAHRLDLPLTARDRQAADAAIAQAGLIAGTFVLIAPTATGLHRGQVKVWPHFAALSRALQSQGVRVVMCPPRAEQTDALQAAPSADMLPPLSLGAFAALTRLARLVICNDSGVSHLSAAVNARQITLFGVTDPARTAPWTPDSVNLGQNGQWPALADVVTRVLNILQRNAAGQITSPIDPGQPGTSHADSMKG
jgi:heptosyltransferase-2